MAALLSPGLSLWVGWMMDRRADGWKGWGELWDSMVGFGRMKNKVNEWRHREDGMWRGGADNGCLGCKWHYYGIGVRRAPSTAQDTHKHTHTQYPLGPSFSFWCLGLSFAEWQNNTGAPGDKKKEILVEDYSSTLLLVIFTHEHTNTQKQKPKPRSQKRQTGTQNGRLTCTHEAYAQSNAACCIMPDRCPLRSYPEFITAWPISMLLFRL